MTAPGLVDGLQRFAKKTFTQGDELDQANQALTMVSAMAQAYTRGRGFTNGAPADEVAAVIYLATMRLLANTVQIEHSKAKGPFSVDYRGGFNGWTLGETFVLDRYRVNAL